uniref:NADH-ubiquinone oxidoreductase chain 2 n=1 Tax=Indirana semipalmata TaxID=691012 RepID=A0A1D9CIX8_9NEOB|nr:NADH dehydrogenase subunit 2 [Indirana semipalmata]
MNPTATSIFISSLAVGTTITLMSHHLFLAWVGLEINTLAIIPLMTLNPHPRAIEAATKYFLTQAAASALLLFSALINAGKTGEWDITSLDNLSSLILSTALLMKLGLAPLHFWMPDVLQGIPLSTGLILSTWQKIAPMALLLQLSQSLNPMTMSIIGLSSILIGGWGGINQTQLRKIMAFSSIGHFGWMVIILKFNPQLTIYNFIFYLVMTAAMFFIMISLSTTKVSDISTSWPKTPVLAASAMLILLSLAGLPPLSGFSPKLLIILELIKQDTITLVALIMLASLLALFFYLRLTYILSLTMSPNSPNSLTSWRTKTATPQISSLLNTAALWTFPLTPTLLLML